MERLLFSLYGSFMKLPLIRLLLKASDERLSKIYPYDTFGRKTNACRSLFTEFAACLLTFALGLLIALVAGFRIQYLLADLLAGVLLARTVGRRIYERSRDRLLAEICDFLDELRHGYFRTHDVMEAIYEAWGSAGEIMKLHLTTMERYFDMSEIPDEYILSAPDNFIITLLAICQNAIRYGDIKTRDRGSTFLKNIEDLEQEIRGKCLEIKREASVFNGSFYLLILPVLFLPVIEKWGTAQIDGLADFFGGRKGALVRSGIVIAVLVVTNIFETMQGSRSANLYLGGRHAVKGYEGKVARQTESLFLTYFPDRNISDFYRERYVLCGTIAVWGIIFNFVYGFSVIGVFAFALLSAAAFFYPFFVLALEGLFFRSKAEDEIATYRSLLLMMSGSSVVSTEEMLTVLERYSFYFKSEMAECLDRYSDNDERAFDALKTRDFKELHRIADDFYAVDKVGAVEGFNDIDGQKKFYGERRKQERDIAFGIKKSIAEVMVYVPFGAVVFMYLVVPFMYESVRSLASFMELTNTGY